MRASRDQRWYIVRQRNSEMFILQKLEVCVLRKLRLALAAIATSVLLLTSCAAPSNIIRTLRDPSVGQVHFSNVLVISVAGDFASRAQFESEIAAAFSADNAAATAYYTVVGRSPQVSRNAIHNAVRARSFDAVLFVRLKGQDDPGAVDNRPTGSAFNLFLYDYPEFNSASGFKRGSTATFVSELYVAASQQKIWAIESLLFEHESADQVIASQVKTIAGQLRKDKLIRN
jgi:hypothetical protein